MDQVKEARPVELDPDTAWDEWENKPVTIKQVDLDLLINGVELLSRGVRLNPNERKRWVELHGRLSALVDPLPEYAGAL